MADLYSELDQLRRSNDCTGYDLHGAGTDGASLVHWCLDNEDLGRARQLVRKRWPRADWLPVNFGPGWTEVEICIL